MKTHRIMFGVMLALMPLAVLSAKVDVRLHVPPPGALKMEQLWWMDIDNPTHDTFVVCLHAEIHEGVKGPVFRANTSDFRLPPGLKTIRFRDISIKDQWHAPGYEAFVLRTGSLPEGEYTGTVTVQPGDLGGDAMHLSVPRAPGELRLLLPPDRTYTTDEHPSFGWSRLPGGMAKSSRYTLKVVQVLPGQAKEQAMAVNPAWFEQSDIVQTVLRYPLSAPAFTPGTYCWQVTALSGGRTFFSSIWEFIFGKCKVVQFEYTGIVKGSADVEPEGGKSTVTLRGAGEDGEEEEVIADGGDRQKQLSVKKTGKVADGTALIEIPPSSVWEHPCTAGGSGQPNGLYIEGKIHLQGCCKKRSVTVEITICANADLKSQGSQSVGGGTGPLYIDGQLVEKQVLVSGTESKPFVLQPPKTITKTFTVEKCKPVTTYTAQWNFPSANNASDPNGSVSIMVTLLGTQKITGSSCLCGCGL